MVAVEIQVLKPGEMADWNGMKERVRDDHNFLVLEVNSGVIC